MTFYKFHQVDLAVSWQSMASEIAQVINVTMNNYGLLNSQIKSNKKCLNLQVFQWSYFLFGVLFKRFVQVELSHNTNRSYSLSPIPECIESSNVIMLRSPKHLEIWSKQTRGVTDQFSDARFKHPIKRHQQLPHGKLFFMELLFPGGWIELSADSFLVFTHT